MNISELYKLSDWVRQEVEERSLVTLYQNLHKILHLNSQPGQPQTPFENEKKKLISALQDINLRILTFEQKSMLDKLYISDNVGDTGVRNLNEILYINSLDMATAAKKIHKKIDQLGEAIAWANQISSSLEEIDIPIEVLDGEVLLRVNFTDDTAINNLSDLKKWGTIWHDIGRGITMISGCAPEEIRVVGASRGSIILELAVATKIASLVAGIILLALKVAERIIEVRQASEKLKSMKFLNEKHAMDLEKEVTRIKSQGLIEIEEKVKLMVSQAENQGEQNTQLRMSIGKLIDFLSKGGIVDMIPPEEDGDEDEAGSSTGSPEIKKLQQEIQEIRQIEDQLKLLSFDNGELDRPQEGVE